MQRTIKLILPKHRELLDTIEMFNRCCNYHIAEGLRLRTTNKNILHKECYKTSRIQWPKLNSSLVQAARDLAIESIKGNKFRQTTTKKLCSSIRYNTNAFTPFLNSGSISLCTIDGRKRYGINIPTHFQQYVGWNIKACTLGVAHKHLTLNLIAETDTPTIRLTTNVLGIDIGQRNLCALSNGILFSASHNKRIRRKISFLRRNLQKAGTRSSKRHLRRMRSRERRHNLDCNHCISKKIVATDFGAFALEDLGGIRNQKSRGREVNRRLHRWPFYQLRQLITQKAERVGKAVVMVDPRYTSQRCNKCGFIDAANRKSGWFHCGSCGQQTNADINAARNISYLGNLGRQAPVNEPIVTSDDVGCSLHVQTTDGSCKPHVFNAR